MCKKNCKICKNPKKAIRAMLTNKNLIMFNGKTITPTDISAKKVEFTDPDGKERIAMRCPEHHQRFIVTA